MTKQIVDNLQKSLEGIIVYRFNRRPREKLNFLTPNEVFFKHFA